MTSSRGIVFVLLSPTRDSRVSGDFPVSGADFRAVKFLRHCRSNGVPLRIITNSYGASLLQGLTQSLIVLRPPGVLDRVIALDLIKTYLLLPLYSIRAILRFRGWTFVASSSLPPDAVPLVLASLFRRRAWVYLHHWVRIEKVADLLRKVIQLGTILALKVASVQVLTSPSTIPFINNLIGKESLHTFRNGVDYVPTADTSGRRDIDLLYLGRVAKKKGSEDLIRIFEAVLKSDGSRRLTVAGPVEDLHFFETLQRSSSAAKVVVRGPVTEYEKAELLRRAKCFVSPSHEEGWGISVSEALSAGLPVVAYDLPAYNQFKAWMHLVPMGDTLGFAQAILSIDTMNQPPAPLQTWREVCQDDLVRIFGPGRAGGDSSKEHGDKPE